MLKNLIGDTIKYGIGNIVIKFFSILVVPIIAKNFPPAIFGEINIITTFVGLFTGITVLGLDSAAGYYYYQGKEELKRDYLGTAFSTRMIIAVIFYVLFFVFAKSLSGTNFLLKNQDRYLLIVLGAAVIPFDNCMSFFIDLTRFLIKPILYNIVNLSKIVLYYGLIVFFLLTNLTVEKIFISLVFSSIVPSLFLFFYHRRLLNIRINLYCLKKMLKYGLPLVPTTIMFWFMNSVSRFVLNTYVGLKDTGIYSLMISLSSVFLLITGSILTAWPPYAMSIAKRDDAREIYARIIQMLLVLLIPLAFLFWSVSDIAILLFSTREYLKGENIIILIVIQHILVLLYQCVAIGLTLKRKTIFITIGYSISGILVILLSFPLCKYFGILGAALSVFIGYLIAILYIFYKSNQFYPIPYNRKFILAYLSLTLFILCLTLIIPNNNLIINFIIRFVIGCCYMCIPFVYKIVSIQDIKNFISIKK
jgi:O-antigen/teichoic acid export membrane protein